VWLFKKENASYPSEAACVATSGQRVVRSFHRACEKTSPLHGGQRQMRDPLGCLISSDFFSPHLFFLFSRLSPAELCHHASARPTRAAGEIQSGVAAFPQPAPVVVTMRGLGGRSFKGADEGAMAKAPWEAEPRRWYKAKPPVLLQSSEAASSGGLSPLSSRRLAPSH
jgi:hypothetical protein